MKVEVFKTNIQRKRTAAKLKMELLQLFPGSRINFDLDDCDRILRIESTFDVGPKIEEAMNKRGFYCEELF